MISTGANPTTTSTMRQFHAPPRSPFLGRRAHLPGSSVPRCCSREALLAPTPHPDSSSARTRRVDSTRSFIIAWAGPARSPPWQRGDWAVAGAAPRVDLHLVARRQLDGEHTTADERQLADDRSQQRRQRGLCDHPRREEERHVILAAGRRELTSRGSRRCGRSWIPKGGNDYHSDHDRSGRVGRRRAPPRRP